MKNTKVKNDSTWYHVSILAWLMLVLGICLCLTGCAVDGPTISYGSNDGFESGLVEIPDEYPCYYVARVNRVGLYSTGNGAFIRVLVDIPMVEDGNDVAVNVPAVCMDDISVGTYCFLIEHDDYSGYSWAGLDPDLDLYPVVNEVVATERVG